MRVTIDKTRSDEVGLEAVDISLVFDQQRNILMLYGMLLPNPNYQFENDCVEPGVLCSFHNKEGKIIYAQSAKVYISFRLNRFSFFSTEISSVSEKVNLENVSEIRLTPFLSSGSVNNDLSGTGTSFSE